MASTRTVAFKAIEIRAGFHAGSAGLGFPHPFIAKPPPPRRDGWDFGISILPRLQPERSSVFVGPEHLRVSDSEKTGYLHKAELVDLAVLRDCRNQFGGRLDSFHPRQATRLFYRVSISIVGAAASTASCCRGFFHRVSGGGKVTAHYLFSSFLSPYL